ncbi:MAG: hypothetical protein EBX40_03965, partial [Gammaproteobacteria bacterium]|nr:hypothetical protein [Gammaproteobacteria bacterium]
PNVNAPNAAGYSLYPADVALIRNYVAIHPDMSISDGNNDLQITGLASELNELIQQIRMVVTPNQKAPGEALTGRLELRLRTPKGLQVQTIDYQAADVETTPIFMSNSQEKTNSQPSVPVGLIEVTQTSGNPFVPYAGTFDLTTDAFVNGVSQPVDQVIQNIQGIDPDACKYLPHQYVRCVGTLKTLPDYLNNVLFTFTPDFGPTGNNLIFFSNLQITTQAGAPRASVALHSLNQRLPLIPVTLNFGGTVYVTAGVASQIAAQGTLTMNLKDSALFQVVGGAGEFALLTPWEMLAPGAWTCSESPLSCWQTLQNSYYTAIPRQSGNTRLTVIQVTITDLTRGESVSFENFQTQAGIRVNATTPITPPALVAPSQITLQSNPFYLPFVNMSFPNPRDSARPVTLRMRTSSFEGSPQSLNFTGSAASVIAQNINATLSGVYKPAGSTQTFTLQYCVALMDYPNHQNCRFILATLNYKYWPPVIWRAGSGPIPMPTNANIFYLAQLSVSQEPGGSPLQPYNVSINIDTGCRDNPPCAPGGWSNDPVYGALNWRAD